MHLNIPHKFTKTEALSRVKNALEYARPQIAGKAQVHEERWDGSTLHFDITADGHRISGTFAVEDAQFVLDAKLPLMMRLFEGRIEKELAEQIKKAM
jgi:hypothetical protein